MGQNSKIEWTDHTFNPWIGCTKVSAGCEHCYAERDFGIRQGVATWGAGGTRIVTKEDYWKQPRRWNRAAEKAGMRPRVFCGSLCDVFEDRPDLLPIRWRLWHLIRETPNLDWLLLTKRPENVGEMLTPAKVYGAAGNHESPWPLPNIWLGTSVEDQAAADARIPELLKVPARVRFLSCEPLLGPVDLSRWLHAFSVSRDASGGSALGWLIAGGESGPQARPSHPYWFRVLRDQCQDSAVPFFFKQWGEWEPMVDADSYAEYMMFEAEDGDLRNMTRGVALRWPDGRLDIPQPTREWWRNWLRENDEAIVQMEDDCPVAMHRVGKKVAGRLFEGREYNEVPT